MIDLHSHLLPYVDDGAADMEEALKLLRIEARQGVTEVCLTPHLRRNMFETSDARVREIFSRLSQAARGERYPKLHLSREYYFDSDFLTKLEERTLMPMGPVRTVLIEFAANVPMSTMRAAAESVIRCGYTPMFAHIERCKAIQARPEAAHILLKKGVVLQVNADSILGLDGRRLKGVSRSLLEENCVHVVAGDAHNTFERTPNMLRCAQYIENKYGREYAVLLMMKNPKNILIKGCDPCVR